MIQRDPRYYTTGYTGKDPGKAPFYLRSLIFDGDEGDFNTALIDEFNGVLQRSSRFSGCSLTVDKGAPLKLPMKIVVINASHDNLPTSYETARIFDGYCREKGYETVVKVVNSRSELMEETQAGPNSTLIMSQCVDKHAYNAELAEELEKIGAVIVPGRVTAPGSIFSDKDKTYQLLSGGGRTWEKVARYKKIPVEGKNVEDVVEDIFSAIDQLQMEIGQNIFFIKPHEGGGGLGGFRVTKQGEGYIIPDLSKLTGDVSEIHPMFVDIDTGNEARLRELLWIYRLFAMDRKMTANYLKVDLPVSQTEEHAALNILREYLLNSKEKRDRKLAGMVITRDEAKKRLVAGIGIFEKKFNRRYIPLVNEHIDFGLWGLRAHYRISREGPVLETMYHRIFQLAFTEEGLGYVGSDNISNKQTGELEITRLGPLNEIMVEAIGGKNVLFESLIEGAEALVELAGLLPKEEAVRVPLRLQLDLAALSKRIGEGNADTARGMCLASRWSDFVRHAREWLEDSLAYYSWKKK